MEAFKDLEQLIGEEEAGKIAEGIRTQVSRFWHKNEGARSQIGLAMHMQGALNVDLQGRSAEVAAAINALVAAILVTEPARLEEVARRARAATATFPTYN